MASPSTVITWLEPCARAAWYSGRSASATTTGSAPISTTSAWAMGSTGAAAVTPKLQSTSRCRSMLNPVKVMAGCTASPMAPAERTGSRTSVPKRPAVCTTSWPGCHAPVAARPATSPGSWSSGTASSTSSLRSTMVSTSSTGTSGSRAAARSRLSADDAWTPTTAWPAARSAAPRTAPTFPALMTPTPRRPGRWLGEDTRELLRGLDRTAGGFAPGTATERAAAARTG